MTLFAILICFALQRYLGLRPKNCLAWVSVYAQHGERLLTTLRIKNAIVIVILLVIPVALIIGGLDELLEKVWFNTLEFVFNVVILFFCLDARSLRTRLTDYFSASERSDVQAAWHYGTDFLVGQPPAGDHVSLMRGITQKIFLDANVYIFSVLFWYILAGPMGAAVYAFVACLSMQTYSQSLPFFRAANQLRAILDWVPVRITGVTYALMGHFASAINYWSKRLFSGLQQTQQLAFGTGMAALELNHSDVALANIEENKAALELVDRTVVLWIVMIALFTLVAWIR